MTPRSLLFLFWVALLTVKPGTLPLRAQEPTQTAPVPEAFQCTVGDKPVFAYVYVNEDARGAALEGAHVNRNLCLTFPSDPAQPPVSFEGVVGTNWLLASREAAVSDELNQKLGGGGLRQELSCAAGS